MLTRFAEIFTSILFCLEQVVSEKWAVWRQCLCRIAMSTRFSSLSKFYSDLFLVLGMGAREENYETTPGLTGKSPAFGDSCLGHAHTAL